LQRTATESNIRTGRPQAIRAPTQHCPERQGRTLYCRNDKLTKGFQSRSSIGARDSRAMSSLSPRCRKPETCWSALIPRREGATRRSPPGRWGADGPDLPETGADGTLRKRCRSCCHTLSSLGVYAVPSSKRTGQDAPSFLSSPAKATMTGRAISFCQLH
jgi:hypothetical protein